MSSSGDFPAQRAQIQAQIEALETEVKERRDRLVELRRRLARGEVENYQLRDADGPVRLSELFEDRDDLLVIHNMGSSCRYCTLWADGLDGMLPHLEDRTAIALVSPDTPETQQKFAAGRGWSFRTVSDAEGRFTDEMGFIQEWEGEMGQWPGFSTFHKDSAGTIHHIASDSFGPGDVYCGLWNLFDHLESGVDGWEPKHHYERAGAAVTLS